MAQTHIARQVTVDGDRLAEYCRDRGIRWLALFGSALRGDFRPDSDVDLLVEFEPGRTPGLAFFTMQAELATIFGRRVDLSTLAFLSPTFRKQVQCHAHVLYDSSPSR